MSKENTFASLPTGFGKSMCYVIPPLISKRTALVISPLKSIMNEQRTFLKSKGNKEAILVTKNEMLPGDEESVTSGEADIIFCSPESAQSWFHVLTSEILQVSLLTIQLK